jgi:hypothetical protein
MNVNFEYLFRMPLGSLEKFIDAAVEVGKESE